MQLATIRTRVVAGQEKRSVMAMTHADSGQYRDEVGELIANYVVNVSGKLDARAERAAKAALIDSIAVAIAALRHPAAQNARKHAYRFAANGTGCVIWGTPKRALPELAALTNGVLLRCHDYNDFFVGRRNSGHSSDILSGVIAAAEWTDAPGKKLLSAIAVGYEMVGAAFDAFSTAPGGWDYTNLMQLGATAAIARLLDLERRPDPRSDGHDRGSPFRERRDRIGRAEPARRSLDVEALQRRRRRQQFAPGLPPRAGGRGGGGQAIRREDAASSRR